MLRTLLILLGLTGAATGQDVTDADIRTDAERLATMETHGSCLIQNVTILTVSKKGTIENGSILVRDGKITAIGSDLKAPEGIVTIDARGLFVMPGIIDCHSHIALASINEGSQSIVPEVRIKDVLDPTSISIYRAAAGGCTSANALHGSANPIGGQNAVIKMKYQSTPEELLFPGAPQGVKFALGENPKQSNWDRHGTRFPNTRMGVEAVYRRAFTEAQKYQMKWKDYEKAKTAGNAVTAPRKDLRMDALVGIMKGEIIVHCHSYRADEILMVMKIAEDFGFRIATLQHVLEGYKVAPEIAKHGAGASTFADWWAYKIEAYDAIPYNAALMTRAGILTSINSDSGDYIRRLNQEAAKAIKYGGLTEQEALALITINPAKQLRIDSRVGSIEKGKDADLAFYNGHPLSPYSRCVMTIIDGRIVFEDREVPDHTSNTFSLAERTRRVPPEPPTNAENVFAIRGATIMPVTSDPIENGTILVRNGTIAAMGEPISIPDMATVVDGKGLFVYPGMIDAGTGLGLTEIGSVRGTRDDSEIGGVQPDLIAATAVHADSELIPVTRANGITTVLTLPRGGSIAGQASMIQLHGWTRKEMTVAPSVGLVVNFPTPPENKKDDPRQEKELQEWFESAKRYEEVARRAKDRGAEHDRDSKLEALAPFATGAKRVILFARDARTIRAAVMFADKLKLNYVLAGGREAWKVRSLLKKKNVSLLLTSPFLSPGTEHERYDATFRNAARLHEAGIRFAFITEDASNVRNLPYLASTAAAFGLPRDEALRAVTIRPAEILGMANLTGSLEVGKRADLIVTTGDPLEIITDVVYSFIGGRPASLESRHTRLYHRYRKRLSLPKD